MAAITRRPRSPDVIWPGFVDALATLLMVIMFLLTVFMLAQFFLNELLTGRDAAMVRLERQISELSELLALESQANADLRLSVAQLSDQLQSSTAERDTLSARLGELMAERESLAAGLARMTERAGTAAQEAERVRAELEDAFKVISADKEKIEVQLRELESLRRDVVALKTVRTELETEVRKLAAGLRAKEEEAAGLSEELTASRDRSKELEARLASEEERTLLAQKEIEKRDIRLRELFGRLQTTDKDLAEELKLSANQRARIDLLSRQIAALRQQLARIIVALEASEAKAKEHRVQIVDLGRRLNAALAGKVEELSKYRSEFFGRLREVLGNHPGIRVVGDRFVFQSEVLFASGSAALNPEGEAQLAQLAETLKDIGSKIPEDINWILRVDGHTDRVPISNPTFPSNWELSTARAMSVVRFLISQDIRPKRLAATGFGEFQPIDMRNDEIGYRRNRRIELKLTQR